MVLISLSPSPFLSKDAMTNNQIHESEEAVLQVIRANDLVFAKESPLSLAKEIQGLRAVFDEVPHTHTSLVPMPHPNGIWERGYTMCT